MDDSDPEYPTVYGLWTNKGGVGKTTLTFHLATTYAELFPDKEVVVIDMCPQANLSSTLLTSTNEPGDLKVQKLHERPLVQRTLPKTVAGFLIDCLQDKRVSNPQDWIINVRSGINRVIDGNNQVAPNLYLFCGDTTLDLLVENLNTRAGDSVRQTYNPYKNVHMELNIFVAELARSFKEKGKEAVFFIDTNPAMSIYTQIALVAMTELIIPVDADNFSMQAVKKMFHLVYGLYPATGVAAEFEDTTFAYKARKYQIPLPKISAIVHNRTPVINQNAAAGAQNPRAYRQLADGHAGLLYDGYQKAMQNDDLERVFLPRGAQPFQTLLQFSAAYTGTMRDMRSCGVAALHTGLPLYLLKEKAHLIPPGFKAKNFTGRLPFLMKDFLRMMQVVFGSEVMQQADADAMTRLQLVANEADLAPAGDDDSSSDDGRKK